MRYAHPTMPTVVAGGMAAFLCLLLICTPAAGTLNGNGALYPCAPGGTNLASTGGRSCVTSRTGDDTGIFVFGVGQSFGPNTDDSTGAYIGRYEVYVPFSGTFRAGLALCASVGRCTLQAAHTVLVGLSEFYLTSTATIYKQKTQTGGYPANTLSSAASGCTVLVDSRGVRWSSNDRTSCADGHQLPVTPADCYLNDNVDLNIDLGTLERGSLSTLPAAGSPGNVKKEVPVLCTRDAGTTLSTTFQYTPLTFNGNEVISAGAKGLGVAVFYKDQPVGPSSAPINETFVSGYTVREFEFQAVRDPAVPLSDIPPGHFTASATMVMTQQ